MIISNHNNTYLWCTTMTCALSSGHVKFIDDEFSNKRNIIETENWCTDCLLILTSSLNDQEVCVLCMSYLSLLVFFTYLFIYCLRSFGWICAKYAQNCIWFVFFFFFFSVWKYRLFCSALPLAIRNSFLRIREIRGYSIGTVLVIGYHSSNLRVNVFLARIFALWFVANSCPYRRRHWSSPIFLRNSSCLDISTPPPLTSLTLAPARKKKKRS